MSVWADDWGLDRAGDPGQLSLCDARQLRLWAVGEAEMVGSSEIKELDS